VNHTLGIIIHGATGRIGSTQHLANALVPICAAGGVVVGEDVIQPRLLLLGRNSERLARLAETHGIEDWSTNLNNALADTNFPVFLDAASTHLRFDVLRRAIAAGKHVYSEKPLAPSVADGLTLLKEANARGVKHGAVEDKLYTPGYLKLAQLAEQGFFGQIVGFRLEFGWWVFDGIDRSAQRPSWNYRRAGGGGIVSDMHPHWRYLIENLCGPIARVFATVSTAQPERIDEHGKSFKVDVEDNVSAIVELKNGVIGNVCSSWATRVDGEELLRFQVDGTLGSAVAGVRRCKIQTAEHTPLVTGFNLGSDAKLLDDSTDYAAGWKEVPELGAYKNPFRVGWEAFITHVTCGTPLVSDFNAGVRDVQLAEACLKSAATGSWESLAPPPG